MVNYNHLDVVDCDIEFWLIIFKINPQNFLIMKE